MTDNSYDAATATCAAGADGGQGDIGECTCGSLTLRLWCILSYDGSTKDIVINYLLLGLNLLYCVVVVLSRDVPDRHQQRSRRWRQVYHFTAATSLVFVVVFQIVLCLAIGCSGVSIIWCAMCGWIVSERIQQRMYRSIGSSLTRLEHIELWVVLVDVLTIVYYAIAFPFITTVAHICALILGAILSLISIKARKRGEYPEIGNEGNARTVPSESSESSNM